MIKFTQIHEGSDYKIELTTSSESTLSTVIQLFESFLLASGYVFDGHLELVDEEEETDGNR